MDTTTLSPIIVFAIKLPFVAFLALAIALTLWMVEHALRHGAVFETKPGPIRTRADTPLRYWLYIIWKLLFVAASAVMIHVIIQLGEPRDRPAAQQTSSMPFVGTAFAAPENWQGSESKSLAQRFSSASSEVYR